MKIVDASEPEFGGPMTEVLPFCIARYRGSFLIALSFKGILIRRPRNESDTEIAAGLPQIN
jgi:hypothetical protein